MSVLGFLGKLLGIGAILLLVLVAVVVYFVMVIVSRSITAEDVKLIPKGEKIAKLLHIK